ncbi:DUF1549 and DUF1553 domain-containing protein [Zavarzinella formosa]|uniref:DUF1549 and DUF1553 domain-containing protein n=1 Tax=Zavarzinella formosa TaxID=360055 RepID=UPI00030F1FD6|nr:DUF1549 and DUF1553 domain-containing protein [Zavarzinella formosa]
MLVVRRLLSLSAMMVVTSIGVSAEPPVKAADWWAVRPLNKPAVPAGAAHPVDAFIRAKLAEKKISTAAEADRRTLIRRVTHDLTGLPPTPEEMERFAADNSPDAYAKLVDRLLASPRHGERQARRWMDAVHFAETHGHDQDRVRENAWPYRDYLINSFNGDTPYSKFVREQIAGDALYPADPQATVALGLLAAGPWDESTLRDIREDTLDRQMGRYLDRDDIVTTVMQTFTSTTVHCARCHDHKFDPISQADYYALQAVFAGADRGNRNVDTQPAVAAKRAALLRDKQRLTSGIVDTPPNVLRLQLGGLIAERKAAEAKWQTLIPETYLSTGGAELVCQPDGSILSRGKRPETDVVTVVAPVPGEQATALRLEVLTDDSLPHHGPGRQDNGNLHLSEIEVELLKPGADKPEKITLAGATADHDQAGWTIQHALDGNEKTAWGIYPEVGKPHAAVLPFAKPASVPAGSKITVRLKQLHGGGHLIGKFRLSVTNVAPVPPATVAEMRSRLDTPVEKWTDDEVRQFFRTTMLQQVETSMAALPKPTLVYSVGASILPDGGHQGSPKPRVVNVLKRGEITKPMEVATPGGLGAVSALPARFNIPAMDDEAARRSALAEWLTSRDNPMVWRSIVNRVWAWHFGTGLVATVNDFGAMGNKPSHPELLDWLACEFRDGKQSLKELHRLIVTSETYRQSCAAKPGAADADPSNRWLARMNRQRLDAEQIRDTVLLASGRLDLKMGGPSDRQFALRPGVHVTPVVDYAAFDLEGETGRRRSVYRFLFRTLPDPLMESLDCPAGDQLAPLRTNSVTVQQALAMWNSAFMVRHAEHFAKKINEDEKIPEARVRLAAMWCWGRPPTDAETKALLDHATRHGWPSLCRVMFNSNEFVFVN